MLDVRAQLAVWAFVSLVLGVLGGWVSRRAELQRWLRTPLGLALAEVIAFSYYAGIPFLALLSGALTTSLIGLSAGGTTGGFLGFSGQQWLRGIGAAFAALAASLIALWAAARESHAELTQPVSLAESLRLAAYRELHWSPFRALLVVWLEGYLGAVLAALALSLAHGVWWRAAPVARARALVVLVAVLFSSVMYLGVRNLWLAVIGQTLIRWLGERMFSRATSAAPPRASAPQAAPGQH